MKVKRAKIQQWRRGGRVESAEKRKEMNGMRGQIHIGSLPLAWAQFGLDLEKSRLGRNRPGPGPRNDEVVADVCVMTLRGC